MLGMVNFKYVKKNNSYYMWETSDEAAIRSITGNGLNLSLSHTMTLPNSYDTQGNLSASQAAEIQSLIGRSDGKVCMVNYTRTKRRKRRTAGSFSLRKSLIPPISSAIPSASGQSPCRTARRNPVNGQRLRPAAKICRNWSRRPYMRM